jgi:hypothetical protein
MHQGSTSPRVDDLLAPGKIGPGERSHTVTTLAEPTAQQDAVDLVQIFIALANDFPLDRQQG